VCSWRSARQQRERELLLKPEPFREHAHPRLGDGCLLLRDHAGELLAIPGTDRRAGQCHACESVCDHLRRGNSELGEFDGR